MTKLKVLRDENFDVDPVARDIGDRLRAIRKARGMSLDDVVKAGFGSSASAVGAWERGFRAVSLNVLHRLADFYDVPIPVLLGIKPEERGAEKPRFVFDIKALNDAPHAAAPIKRLVRSITLERGDFNGRVLTVRGDDISAICAMLDVDTAAEATKQLDAWGVLALVG